MLKLTLLFRRSPELTQEEFLAHWREVHVPLVKQVPGIARYTISPLPWSPDGREVPFDGMAELYFDSREALDAALASAETAATGRDGRNFIERGSITRLIVDEETIVPDGRAPARTPLSTHRFHVLMADVDAAGHLFYAAPLLWAERLLTSWRLDVGQPVSAMLREGRGSPVVRAEVTYSGPLRLDDEVEGTLWFVGRSARSFTVLCRFAAGTGGRVAAEVQITQVPVRRVDGEARATEVPAELVAQLEGGHPA